jgi:hypothetical protein
MTTPAVNVNNYLLRPGYFYQKLSCAGGFGLQASTNNRWKQYIDQRPASVTNVKSKSGWRNPSGWSHSHLEAVVSPIGDMGTIVMCANKNQYTGSKYIDGEYAVDTGMGTLLSGAVPQWIRNLAATRAYLALKNQNVNLSVAFAERAQAGRMFSTGVKDIATQVERYRKAFPREWGQVVKNGLRRQWKNIPSRWLELQYGWKPFMSDLYGTCEELAKAESGVMAYHARAKGSAKWDEVYNVTLGSSPFRWVYTVNKKHHSKVILYYKLTSPTLATFASLGLTNPLELGWELVKYSFVVDWFLPVGNWLSTLDADLGWSYETGCRSDFMNVEVKSVPRCDAPFGNTSYYNYTVGPSARGYAFTRALLGSPPGVGLPSLKNPFSATHIANAMSLLVQAFR